MKLQHWMSLWPPDVVCRPAWPPRGSSDEQSGPCCATSCTCYRIILPATCMTSMHAGRTDAHRTTLQPMGCGAGFPRVPAGWPGCCCGELLVHVMKVSIHAGGVCAMAGAARARWVVSLRVTTSNRVAGVNNGKSGVLGAFASSAAISAGHACMYMHVLGSVGRSVPSSYDLTS